MLRGMAEGIGTRIKRARERKRWKQRELADALGVNVKTIDNWENGRTSPRSSIGALEDVLGVNLNGTPEPEPEPVSPRLRQAIREEYPDDERLAAVVEAAVEAALRGEPPPRRVSEPGATAS